MRGIRVGFFMLHPNIWFGGGQIALLRVANWLVRKSLTVEIIVSRLEGEPPFQTERLKLVNLNVPVLKVRGKPIVTSIAISAIFGLAKYFRNNPPDVVIAPGWADGSLTLWARNFSKTPLKVGIWEQIHVSSMKESGGNIYRKLAPKIVRLFYRYADIVAACSIGSARDIANLSGLPQNRVYVIYNPIDPEIEQKANEPIDHPWFNNKFTVILTVARLDAQKDIPTLLHAFTLVRQHQPCKLLILGEGPERPKLELMVNELGLQDDVSMPGWVDNPFKFMKRARLFVLSSRFEGFGLVLAEALACGCPVVATDCSSGPAEILENGKWGKLVPVGDHKALARAIIEALGEEPDKEALIARGMEFHIDRIGQKWLEVVMNSFHNQRRSVR